MSEMLKRLLGAPDLSDLPGKTVTLPRLGTPEEPFTLSLRPLSWKQISEMHAETRDEAKIKLLLAACPDLRGTMRREDMDPAHGVMTVEDVVLRRLLPGEIDGLIHELDQLCGYRSGSVISEIKN
ncbi:MAG: hypothetical protein IKM84_04580 [Oscillospiraceae bacterium]|nr:hypothetical protein [Oscillospiraceae bacterium]